MELELRLTNKCQLSCLHCYSSSSPDCNCVFPLDLLDVSINKYIEMTKKMCVKEEEPIIITLTGGEPTLLGVKYLSKAVSVIRKALKRKNIWENINMVSNLLSFNDEIEKFIRSEGISLCASYDPEIRFLQGSDMNFTDTWKKQYCKTKERGLNIPVAFTITKHLIGWNIQDFLNEMQIDAISLQPFQAVGRGYKNLYLAPTLDITSDFIINIMKNRQNIKRISPYDSVKKEYKKFKETGIGSVDCWNDCQNSFSINYDGTIRSSGECVPAYGNIFIDSVDDILMSPSRIKHAVAKTPYIQSACKGCAYEDFCRCGCQGLKKIPSGGECQGLKKVLDYCLSM